MTRVVDRVASATDNFATPADGTCLLQVISIGDNIKVGISAFSAWMLGVGAIIGSMAWLFHAYMIARAGVLASTLAWLVAGLAFLPVTLILAELSSMFPNAGGPYLYKYYAFKRLIPHSGELLGFLTGWLFWACLIAGYACMGNGLSNLLASTIYGSVEASPWWLGTVTICSLFIITTLVNLMPVDRTSQLNSAFTILKFVLAISFGALVLMCPISSLSNLMVPTSPTGGANLFANICSVLTVAIGGFGGIELIACASSETKNAKQNVPKSMFLTLLSVALIYASMCAAIGLSTPISLNADKSIALVAGTDIPATVPGITAYLIGSSWGRVATALVIMSIVGCSIGGMLACARIAYSMAKTGLFPRQFASLNTHTRVPNFALYFQCMCMCMLGAGANLMCRAGVFPDAYSFLGETFCYMYLLLVVLYGISLMSLRYTDKTLERPFRIGKSGNWLAWIMSLLTIGIFGFVAFGCTKLIYQFAAALILLAGMPVYCFYKQQRMPD